MARKLLIGILALSTLLELILVSAMFAVPEWTIGQFKLGVSPDTLFAAFVLAWCLLAIALVCGYATRRVMVGGPGAHTLARILGLWWIGIGIGIYLKFGRPDNLVLDSLKGALIVGLSWLSRRQEIPA